jgi:hypothetical protein
MRAEIGHGLGICLGVARQVLLLRMEYCDLQLKIEWSENLYIEFVALLYLIIVAFRPLAIYDTHSFEQF